MSDICRPGAFDRFRGLSRLDAITGRGLFILLSPLRGRGFSGFSRFGLLIVAVIMIGRRRGLFSLFSLFTMLDFVSFESSS